MPAAAQATTQYQLSLRLFGAVELENSLGRVEENRSRRSLSWLLLKYLLLNRGREVSAEEMEDCLWTGEDDSCDDVALRVRLRRLREALQPLGADGRKGLVLYSLGKYTINPQYDISSDEEIFLRSMERVRTLPINSPEGLDYCARALEAMRGEYMEYTGDAPWLQAYRDYYRRELAWLCRAALERSRALEDDRLLGLLCRRSAALIPEDEELHRGLLAYLMERGRQIELLHYVSQLSRSGKALWLDEEE